MGPIAIAAAGLAALAGWEIWKKKSPPVQVQNVTGAGGVPLQVITPLAPVTPAQATAQPTPPAPLPKVAVAQVVPGQGTVYAPPKMIDTVSGSSVTLAPIIVSPTGSSSVAIGSVKDVQAALNTLGFAPALTVDGKLGPKTIANIKAFQSKNGLVVDGSAGPATKAALSNALSTFVSGGPTAPVAAAADAHVAASKPLTVVSAKDVQHALNLLGAKPPLQEDGKPGPKTIAAIKSFQLAHGLAVDGVAGPKTKAALGIAVGSATPAVAGQFGAWG